MSKQYYSAQDGLGYLGEDLLIQGTVHTEKKIVVSCTLEGSIHGDQEIIVSETGNVSGKIEGNVVVVAGKINGNMLVHERLEVNSTANLNGRNNSIISQPKDKNKNKGQFFLKYFP